MDVRTLLPDNASAQAAFYTAPAAMAADSRTADRCGDSGGGLLFFVNQYILYQLNVCGGLPFCGGKQARSVEYLGGSSTLAIE